MNKEYAIEILSFELTKCTALSNPDLKDAIRLGIEALYMCKRAKEFAWPHWPKFLKGETELNMPSFSFKQKPGQLKDGKNRPL